MAEAAIANQSNRGRLVVEGVTKTYGSGPQPRYILQDCSFEIAPGKLNVVIGPSGCGKTTLLKLIAGFEMPDSGTIEMDGRHVTGPGPDRLVVFQETALFDWMTCYGNVAFGPKARGERTGSIRTSAQALLERVGIGDFRNKYPTQLSGGMQRRVELARAMINNPALMLLDEPFRGLDAMTRRLMQEYLVGLLETSSRTVLFITTDIDEAILIADRLIVLSNTPAHCRTTMAIDLPRPRSSAQIIEDDHANQLKLQALNILHEEAMRSFRQGSKAASDFLDAYAKRISR